MMNMIEFLKVTTAISIYTILSGLFLGCASNEIHSTASNYSINDDEFFHMKDKAVNGDAQTSLKIGDHFFYVESKFEEAEFWYRLASEQGNNEAAFKLSTTLKQLGKDQLAIEALERLDDNGAFALEKNKELGKLYSKTDQIKLSGRHYCEAALRGDRYSSKKIFDIYTDDFGQNPSISYYWANHLLNITEPGTFAYKEVEQIITKLNIPEDKLKIHDAIEKSLPNTLDHETIRRFCKNWQNQYPYQIANNNGSQN